jgi:hypothetical protein
VSNPEVKLEIKRDENGHWLDVKCPNGLSAYVWLGKRDPKSIVYRALDAATSTPVNLSEINNPN